MTKRITTIPRLSAGLCAAIFSLAIASTATSQEVASPSPKESPKKVAMVTKKSAPASKSPAAELTCKGEGTASARKESNPEARAAAQKGLNFLGEKAVAWQKQHNCFGCHVQAVTIEAFAIGKHHQYKVEDPTYKNILGGVTTIHGGASEPLGLRYAHGDTLAAPSKAFGGAALGRHDQLVDQQNREELLKTSEELLGFQQEDGSIQLGWVNQPVGAGAIQGAYQAIQTWQQAYARTADSRWLTAVQKSEAFLQRQIDTWYKTPPTQTQDVNYAILGLLEAGVGTSEASILDLQKRLLAAQNKDGGWSFGLTAGSQSNPFATGQTLYTMRKLGMTDSDKAITAGTTWLIEKQQSNGGWSEAGFGKAEAMWGVLGLVSLDVLSLEVTGLKQGIHVEGDHMLGVEAWDNSGSKVVKIEFLVDDILTHASCGDNMTYTWPTKGLEEGKHVVDVRAINDRQEVSTRRFEVYAGNIFLTQLGSSFSDGGTMISLRNIAPDSKKNTVKLDIFSSKESKGRVVAAKKLRSMDSKGSEGAMTFFWDGKDAKGKDMKAGEKYVARLSFQDAKGKTLQTEELTFVHDTYEAQRAQYSEVAGQLSFGADKMSGVANTVVELVDEEGNVVEQTRSTASGNYRFRNVKKKKKYKVRVRKKGFKAQEKELAPAPAEAKDDIQADFEL